MKILSIINGYVLVLSFFYLCGSIPFCFFKRFKKTFFHIPIYAWIGIVFSIIMVTTTITIKSLI